MRVILLLLVLFVASAAARYICFEEGTSIPAEAIYEPNWESGKAVRWSVARKDGRPLGIAVTNGVILNVL